VKTTEKSPILEIKDLSTYFITFGGERVVKAVDTVSLSANYGDTLALIGESGCGKSTLASSILQVLPEAGRIVGGQIFFEREDLLQKTNREMTKIRGRKIAMILQDPMTSLNPVFTVGNQIGETLSYHLGLRHSSLVKRIKELISAVQIPQPERRMKQ